MVKNIFIILLCFVLLFVAFKPDTIQPTLFDTYDGYRQFYFSSIPDLSYSIDDLWIDDNGKMLRCISDSSSGNFSFQHWTLINQDTIETNVVYDCFYYNFEVDPYFDFESQSDGKIELWYQFADPSLNWMSSSDKVIHSGDRWFDLSAKIEYEWISDHWVESPFLYCDSSVSFDDIFGFGYELTIGTFDVVTSIFKGPDVFFDRLDQWRVTLFGDVTIFDFFTTIVDRSVDFLDSIALKIPVVREIKQVIDNILLPFEDIISDVIEWIEEKIS